MLWAVIIVMCLAAAAAVALPLIRAPQPVASRDAFNRQVYRDQLRELETDLTRGVVTSDEAAGARLEIERRLLATAEDSTPASGARAGRPHRAIAASLAILVPAAGLGLYLWHGSPHQPGSAIATRPHPPVGSDSAATPGDLGQRVTHLAARLEDEPNDTEGWRLLGRSYGVLARHAEAVEAFRRAAVLAPRDADGWLRLARAYRTLDEKNEARDAMAAAALLRSGDIAVLLDYVGAIISAAGDGGRVPPAALPVLRQILALDADNPGALYYMGLAAAAAGRTGEAEATWRRLLGRLDPASPSYATVERQLKSLSGDR